MTVNIRTSARDDHAPAEGRGTLGPRATHDRGPLLSPAQSSVLDELALAGRFRLVSDLAETLGQHPNTVREHLDALVEARLVVRRTGKSSGRGRPANEYRARPMEQTQPGVREYAGLADALAGHIAQTSASPASAAVAAGVTWGVQLADSRTEEEPTTVKGTHAVAARRHVVEIMRELGFDPQPDSRVAMVRLRSCPLLVTAKRHPAVVCGVHLGIVRGVLATTGGDPDRAELLPFAEVGACRLNLLAPSPSQPAGAP